MAETKRCKVCNIPFVAKNNEDTCEDHRAAGFIHSTFGNLEDIKKNIDQYPDLPIIDSVTWKREVPTERRFFLYNIIPEGSITLIAGEAGTGKTMFCLSIVDSLAKGEDFGPWENKAGEPIKCLYFDGEMHPTDLHERLTQMQTHENIFIFSVAKNFMDSKPFTGTLADFTYREAIKIEMLEKGIKFIVIDNLASLAPGLNENIKKDYDPINAWLLSLRHLGITVILVHHLGKSGDQRGTSARMDNVDSSIFLHKPKHYSAEDGMKFKLDFSKFRGKVTKENKDLVKDRDVTYLENDSGQWEWNFGYSILENSKDILRDLVEGIPMRLIAEKNSISQPTVSRRKAMFIDEGYLTKDTILTEAGKMWLNAE